jgi:AAHS family 4-hydroxybenzoate transporter-like MFS transporter
MHETSVSGGVGQTLGASRSRYAVPLACFAIAMIDGYDTLMLSFLAPLISRDWGLAPSAFGRIFASGYAGAALGAAAIGVAADRFGRKTMLLISLAFVGVFTVLCAWATDPLQLMICRALAGIGLGGAIPTISALTAEHASPERSSAMVTRMFLGFPIGAMLGGAITAGVMGSVGWRGVFIGCGACAVLLIPFVALGIRESAARESAARASVHARHPVAELVSDGRGWGTALLCASVFHILLVSYFLVSWTPTALTLNGMSPQRAAMAGVVLNLGGLAGALILSAVIGRGNPLRLVASCIAAGALLIALLGQSILVPGFGAFGLIFVVGLLVIGAQSNIPALGVYFYPAAVRATGVGLSMAVGRLGSIIGPLIGGYLVAARLGWDRLFALAAVPALIAAAAMATVRLKKRS